jgi:hypothetical protein
LLYRGRSTADTAGTLCAIVPKIVLKFSTDVMDLTLYYRIYKMNITYQKVGNKMELNRKSNNKIVEQWNEKRSKSLVNDCIINLSKKIKPNGKILDIGWGQDVR